MLEENEVLLLLGGNSGEPRATLATAEQHLAVRVGPVLSRSRDHWTEPWGFTDDRLFLNRALIVRTDLAASDLLKVCLDIERQLGRERSVGPGYASRTIDIDILLCGRHIIELPELIVPHPRMHERAFALGPAVDIAPDVLHPVLGATLLELLNDLRGSRRE